MTPRERALGIVVLGGAATLAATHGLAWSWGALGVGATMLVAFVTAPPSVRLRLAPLAALLTVVAIVGGVQLVVRG